MKNGKYLHFPHSSTLQTLLFLLFPVPMPLEKSSLPLKSLLHLKTAIPPRPLRFDKSRIHLDLKQSHLKMHCFHKTYPEFHLSPLESVLILPKVYIFSPESKASPDMLFFPFPNKRMPLFPILLHLEDFFLPAPMQFPQKKLQTKLQLKSQTNQR